VIRARPFLISLGLAVLFARGTTAHPLQFSYIDVSVTPAGYDVALTVHAFDAAHDLGLSSENDAIAATFAGQHGSQLTSLLLSRVTMSADGQFLTPSPVDVFVVPDQLAVVVRVHYSVPGNANRLEIAGWLFPYDPIHQTFVKVHERETVTYQDILTATRRSTTYVRNAPQGRAETFQRFLVSGIEHIAIGPDHVLFLIGLLLLGGTFWQLVRIVTGFTLAHSVTLSLAALDLVTPPAALIEPAIALSICYVGLDNLIRRPGSRDRRAWIAFGFGLIHGFGFANVLREIGLPGYLLGWSLFAFNVGVEIGQLAIVAVVVSILAWLARSRPVLHRRIAIAGSVLVVWAGFYWFMERTVL